VGDTVENHEVPPLTRALSYAAVPPDFWNAVVRLGDVTPREDGIFYNFN
jgi:hypothetical protein